MLLKRHVSILIGLQNLNLNGSNGMLAIDRNSPSCDSDESFFTGLSIGRNGSPSITIIFASQRGKKRNFLSSISFHYCRHNSRT